MGEEEAEKKARERRKRVEEANRKDREEGGKATDVLLGEKRQEKGKIAFEEEEVVEKGLRNVRIGEEPKEGPTRTDETENKPGPASAFKKKKKGVRMGGVLFQTDEKEAGVSIGEEEPPKKEKKKVSISAMLHQQPELLDF